MVLVVGASGYLGGLICKELVASGRTVSAVVRPTSDTRYLRTLGVSLVEADLNEPASLSAALDGCQQVICTATAALPTRRGECVTGDGRRAKALVAAAEAARIDKLVYISALIPDHQLPGFWQCKVEAELHLRRSRLDYTILRCGSLMEVSLALLGSTIPTLSAEPGPAHTLERPFPFSRRLYQLIRHDIEQKGTAHVIGNGTGMRSYVATGDVARLAVASLENPFCRRATLQVGTAPITALQAVDLFSKILGRPVRVRRTPLPLLQAFGAAAGLFSPEAGQLLRAAVAMAQGDVALDPTTFRHAYPDYRLQTVAEFLRDRVGLMRGEQKVS
jgi:uncharacterized protein YbjT (DUF2867 family)